MGSILDGQPVNAAVTNTAKLDRQVDDTAYGVLSLANVTNINSGSAIPNLQQTVNDLIQDGKMLIYTATHQSITFSGGNLIVPETLVIRSPDFSVTNTIASGTYALADGEHLYVTLNRYSSGSVSPTISSVLPKSKDVFRVCTRVGTALVFWDNSLLKTGASACIGEIGGQFGITLEVPTQNTTTNFSFTGVPLNASAAYVYIDGVKVPQTNVTFSSTTFDLDADYAVEIGGTQQVELVYEFAGATAPGGGGGDGAYVAFGSSGAPLAVSGAVGVLVSSDQRQLRFIVSTGGAQAVSASPQVSPGSVIGQELTLCGASNTNYLTFADGSGLSLNGALNLKANNAVYLVWDGSAWFEISRR